MAVLRLAVRERKVTCWFVKHRPYMAPFTTTNAETVTWTWDGKIVPFGGTTTNASVTMATMTIPSLEEVRAILGPDCRTVDWVQARYR